MRKNSRTVAQFKKACQDKIDGLRILQFLKYGQETRGPGDEESLLSFFEIFYPECIAGFEFMHDDFTFEELSVEQLDLIRNTLVKIEEGYQKKYHG